LELASAVLAFECVHGAWAGGGTPTAVAGRTPAPLR
jgi:hypothetical protein